MLQRIWIEPPLAFARVGSSSTPSDSFHWGTPDLRPAGSGQTTIIPSETLVMDQDGHIASVNPDEIRFRDEEGIRPVCPWFEVHGSWVENGKASEGVLSVALLQRLGIDTEKISWTVSVANLKAHHYSLQDGDRVTASQIIRYGDHRRHVLKGEAPKGAKRPIVLRGRHIPLGVVQLARDSEDFPELRLRFYAPKGLVYGPSNLGERISRVEDEEWKEFKIPDTQLLINPESTWATYDVNAFDLQPLGPGDNRNSPSGLLAAPIQQIDGTQKEICLGLVDDVSDGVVSCAIGDLVARARIVVGPPDFAPANRPVVSLADGLADRVDRTGPRSNKWSMKDLGELVVDIFERAYETSDLMHKDYQNRRSVGTNRFADLALGTDSIFDEDQVEKLLWPLVDPKQVANGRADALELTETGRRKHRRQAVREYIEDRIREDPEFIDRWIRRPRDPSLYYDKRMPALMRGSDGRPFHLTRRQWEILKYFAISVIEEEQNSEGRKK